MDSHIARQLHFLTPFNLQLCDKVLLVLLKELLVDLLGFQELILIAINPCLHLPITGQRGLSRLLIFDVPVRVLISPLVCHLHLLIVDVEQIRVLFGGVGFADEILI